MAQTALDQKEASFDTASKAFAIKNAPPTIESVKEYLTQHALNAAKKVTSLMEANGDAQVLRLQLDSSKAVLKYVGMETEHVSHSGEIRIASEAILPAATGGRMGER